MRTTCTLDVSKLRSDAMASRVVDLDGLSEAERLELAIELWDSVTQKGAGEGVPLEHQRVLDERLEAHHADPGAARPWSEVLQRLKKQP